MDFISRAVIRFALRVVESVTAELARQINVVEEEALNPLKVIVQSVTDGVWRGKGADAFVEEVSNLAIPGLGQVGDGIRTFQGNVERASQIMTEADAQASQLVQGVVDKFGDVFNG